MTTDSCASTVGNDPVFYATKQSTTVDNECSATAVSSIYGCGNQPGGNAMQYFSKRANSNCDPGKENKDEMTQTECADSCQTDPACGFYHFSAQSSPTYGFCTTYTIEECESDFVYDATGDLYMKQKVDVMTPKESECGVFSKAAVLASCYLNRDDLDEMMCGKEGNWIARFNATVFEHDKPYSNQTT